MGYFRGDAAVCNEIKVIFFKQISHSNTQNDTLLVTVTSNEIAELDQVQLNGWLYKNGNDHLLKVQLKDCGKKTNPGEQAKTLYLQKASKVYEYLRQKGVPKRKIEFE